jgi:hypothetical protein
VSAIASMSSDPSGVLLPPPLAVVLGEPDVAAMGTDVAVSTDVMRNGNADVPDPRAPSATPSMNEPGEPVRDTIRVADHGQHHTRPSHAVQILHAGRHWSQARCACGVVITLGPRSAQSAASVAWAMHVAQVARAVRYWEGRVGRGE